MASILDDAGDFVESGVTAEGGEDAFLFEGEHAGGAGGFFDVGGADVGDVAADEALDGLGDDELFHDGGASGVAEGVFFGDDGLVELEIVKVKIGFDAGEDFLDVLFGGGVGGVGLLVVGELADETLGDEQTNTGAEDGVDADEIDNAGEGGGGGVGVEAGEDEMTGDGSLDGGAGGVGVADFADHDDVGVEAEDATEAFGEGAAVVGVDGDLGDAGDAVFDGVFEGDDFAVGGV